MFPKEIQQLISEFVDEKLFRVIVQKCRLNNQIKMTGPAIIAYMTTLSIRTTMPIHLRQLIWDRGMWLLRQKGKIYTANELDILKFPSLVIPSTACYNPRSLVKSFQKGD